MLADVARGADRARDRDADRLREEPRSAPPAKRDDGVRAEPFEHVVGRPRPVAHERVVEAQVEHEPGEKRAPLPAVGPSLGPGEEGVEEAADALPAGRARPAPAAV